MLCHGDLGLDHIFVKNDEIVGVIDFGNYQTRTIHYDFAYLGIFSPHLDIDYVIQAYFSTTKKPIDFDYFVNLYLVIEGFNAMAYLLK